MEKNKLKIGEFSRLGRVTVRALRHYEEIDLLTPEIVDRDTGYRYYSVGQLQKIFSITKLKSMGYSLEEIRDLWDDDQHFPTVESLEKKIRKCEDEGAQGAETDAQGGGDFPKEIAQNGKSLL